MLRPLAAAAAALLAAAVPAAGSPWSAAETVMPALRAGRLPYGNPPGWLALAPAVAVRGDGTAALVWTSKAARRGFVAVRLATRARGGQWSRPRTIGTSKGFPTTGAALSVAGDFTAVAWSSRLRSVEAPRIHVWTLRSGALPALDGPATSEAAFIPAVVAAPDGEVLAVWEGCACPRRYTVNFPGGLGSAVRSPRGAWSTPTTLDPNAAGWTLAGAPSGAAALVWGSFTFHPPPPLTGPHLATRTPGAPLTVEDAVPASQGQFVLFRPDGSLATLGAGYDTGVGATSRTAAGWAAPVQVAPPGRIGNRFAAAALSDGRLAAAWTEAVGTEVRLYAAIETTPGGAWSAPAQLASSHGGIGRLTLAAGPHGAAVLAWTQQRRRRVRSRVLQGVRWEPATDVSPQGKRCDLPAVAVGRDGRALAAFVCGTARPAVLVAERNVG